MQNTPEILEIRLWTGGTEMRERDYIFYELERRREQKRTGSFVKKMAEIKKDTEREGSMSSVGDNSNLEICGNSTTYEERLQ